MKIAIVVQGRFHAFDLGRALLKRGHDVTLLTNYPRRVVQRFGFPAERVRSFILHGLISRAAHRVAEWTRWQPEMWINPMFGRWARQQLMGEQWDVIHGWSGVSAELHVRQQENRTLHLVMRGSAHIREQEAILRAEEDRTGIRLERPGKWIIDREEWEYQASDRIVLLSSFAYRSFLEQGVSSEKLRVIPLGVDTSLFSPGPEGIEERCRRILSGQPLQVLYTGNISLQKGMWDLAKVVRLVKGSRLRFRLIGRLMADSRPLFRGFDEAVEIVPKQPQSRLPEWYALSDVFMFPTLQDGFAAVLAQAKANGLPILTTPNCSGPDILCEGETGWILPIRNPEAFAQRLLWCDENRSELAEMVRRVYRARHDRSWEDVAADFEAMCVRELVAKRSSVTLVESER